MTLVANDTRGGVEPYLALAVEGVSRGHTVRVVAPPQYEAEVLALGAQFVGLAGAEHARAIAAEGRMSLREMGRRVVALTGRWAVDAAAGAVGTDVVVAGIGGMALARQTGQAVGAPVLRAHLQPLDAPSTRYSGPLAPRLGVFGPAGRRLSHTVTELGTSLLSRSSDRAAREALGLRGSPHAPLPTIVYGFGEAVVPVASDSRVVRVPTGYWTLPSERGLDDRVEEFLARPGPVISVGFGSMVAPDPVALRTLVIGAGRRAGARVVLLTGWGAVDAPPETEPDVLVLSSVPHAKLFPRLSATVHHGGAGTTGAALTAGIPTVIVPFAADQPFWAARAHHLGVAPRPVPLARLTEDRLTAAIHDALTDAAMRRRARELGDVLRADGGAPAAVDIIETAGRDVG